MIIDLNNNYTKLANIKQYAYNFIVFSLKK